MSYPRTTNTYTSFASQASGVVKVDAGAVLSFFVTNTATVTRYFMIFDRTTVPTTGLAPKLVFPVYGFSGATEVGEAVLTQSGYVVDAGLAWGLSTEPASFSAAPPTDPLVIITWV